MLNDPVSSTLSFLAAAYALYLWIKDYQYYQTHGTAKAGTMPGATPAGPGFCIVACVGALIIIAVTTGLELLLGVSGDQTTISHWFLFAMLAAAIIEEVIFRGFLYIRNRGRLGIVISAFVFSLLFALLHPYLWQIEKGDGLFGFKWYLTLDTQAIIATASICILSLWFYYCRFSKHNPYRSMLPCFLSHASANICVYFIKWAGGFVQ